MTAVYPQLRRLIALLLALFLLLLNLRLYSPGSADYGPEKLGPDVLPQLRFIKSTLESGAGNAMQGVFPEGYFFSHVFYGLSWVEVGMRVPVTDPLRAEAIDEARWALDQLDSPAGRAPFSPDLKPTYGIFYAGWLNWLRGGILLIQPPEARNSDIARAFQTDCENIARAFDGSNTPFLTSYPSQAWPVDSVVGIAALRLHDQLFPAKYTATINNWLEKTKARLDPETGLIPHRVDPVDGYPLEGARGTSQSIIARFLIEIDPEWGRSQYALFRKQFVAPFLGVPGVREYPAGKLGLGDVDSGPLVFGFSASATVVETGAAQVQGDVEVADALFHATEAVGFPISTFEDKRYLLGALPIGDTFVVWSKTARPWITTPWQTMELPSIVHRWWRLPFHAVSVLIIAVLWAGRVAKRKKTTQKQISV
jgi:hypothetical protein